MIRKYYTPDPTVRQPWEPIETPTAHHDSSAYDQDKLTVHNIIIQNISNGSYAYIYVSPHIKRDDEIREIKALRGRYGNAEMHDQYFNKSKRNPETMAYSNERAIKFEKFVAKFTQAVGELEKRNQWLHNAEVVDLIWKKMMNLELSQYITALKVQFQLQPRDYQEIIQEISSQVPSLHVPKFRKLSKVDTQYHSHTKECPDKGNYDDRGKMYIGKYFFHKWIDESVKPRWGEIRSAQSQGRDKYSLNKKCQDKKREKLHLKTAISELLTKKSRTEASIASIITDESSSATPMS